MIAVLRAQVEARPEPELAGGPVPLPAGVVVVDYTDYCRPLPGWKGRPRPWRKPTWMVCAGNVRPASLVASILHDVEQHANQVRVHVWKDGRVAIHSLKGHRLGPPLAFVDGMSGPDLEAGIAAQPGEPD